MKEKELEYYSKIANWDFSKINYEKEILTKWDYFEEIRKNTNEKSLCLDLGTGGGESVLKKYPNVGMIIGTDFSKEMISTARENSKKYPEKKVKFVIMDNLKMNFPNNLFDLVSARHTKIDAKQIYKVLRDEGILVIEGVDKKDCWELKEIFGKGQGFDDVKAISKIDYEDLLQAGFSKVELTELLINEYYKTEEDLINLLIKAPILDNFSETKELNKEHLKTLDINFLHKYINKYKTKRGILLKRVLYGIVAKK